jgi:hypothetical protein
MRLIKLFQIPDDTCEEVGKFLLLFSHVEWLIANVLLYNKITPREYTQVQNLSFMKEYFEMLLGMNCSRKIDALAQAGFDSTRIKEMSIYRNTLSHGIIFKDESNFTVRKVAKMNDSGAALNKNELQRCNRILMEEGGKLLDFLEQKGYKYIEPAS